MFARADWAGGSAPWIPPLGFRCAPVAVSYVPVGYFSHDG